MCTSSCNGISRAREEARNQAAVAIARKLVAAAAGDRRRAAMRVRSSAKCSTFSPRFAITARWPPSGRLLSRNAERHLKSPAEMARLFADLPEAIANTVELSSRLEFTLNDLGYQFPRYPVPDGGSQMDFLRAAHLRRHDAAGTVPGTSGRGGRSSTSWR